MLKLNQQEKAKLYHEGKTFILNYRKVYQINWCGNLGKSGDHILREIERLRKFDGIPYTLRGRYITATPETAMKIINS